MKDFPDRNMLDALSAAKRIHELFPPGSLKMIEAARLSSLEAANLQSIIPIKTISGLNGNFPVMPTADLLRNIQQTLNISRPTLLPSWRRTEQAIKAVVAEPTCGHFASEDVYDRIWNPLRLFLLEFFKDFRADTAFNKLVKIIMLLTVIHLALSLLQASSLPRTIPIPDLEEIVKFYNPNYNPGESLQVDLHGQQDESDESGSKVQCEEPYPNQEEEPFILEA